MVTLAGRKHPWHATPGRVQGRENFLSRRTMGGVRQRTTCSLEGSTAEGGAMTMANQARKAEQFRTLHTPAKPLILFNIWDVGSSKAVAMAGAKAIATSSWSVANAGGFSDGEQTPRDFAI